jgi:AcrR family transcriptional regulator
MLARMPRVYKSSKGKILDAAERLIVRDGPRAVTVDAVLAESGVSKGGFFHHFPTKEALLSALLERLSADVAQRADSRLAGDTGDGRSLRAQIALAFDMPPGDRKRTRALVLALLAGAMEAPSVATTARAANRKALADAEAQGVDAGTALVVQLALDGYFLGESIQTIKLDPKRKAAFRQRLLDLVDRSIQQGNR